MAEIDLNAELLLNTKPFNEGLKESQNKAKGFSASMENIGNSMKGAFSPLASIGPAVVGLFAASKAQQFLTETLKFADSLDQVAKNTKQSAENVQRFRGVLSEYNITAEDADKIQLEFNKSIAEARDPSSAAAQSFAKMGINIKDANGNVRSSNALFQDLLKNFRTLSDQDQTTVALQLLGKTGKETFDLLNQGAADFNDKLSKQTVVSNENVAKLAAFNDAIEKTGRRTTTNLQSFIADVASVAALAFKPFAGAINGLGALLGGDSKGLEDRKAKEAAEATALARQREAERIKANADVVAQILETHLSDVPVVKAISNAREAIRITEEKIQAAQELTAEGKLTQEQFESVITELTKERAKGQEDLKNLQDKEKKTAEDQAKERERTAKTQAKVTKEYERYLQDLARDTASEERERNKRINDLARSNKNAMKAYGRDSKDAKFEEQKLLNESTLSNGTSLYELRNASVEQLDRMLKGMEDQYADFEKYRATEKEDYKLLKQLRDIKEKRLKIEEDEKTRREGVRNEVSEIRFDRESKDLARRRKAEDEVEKLREAGILDKNMSPEELSKVINQVEGQQAILDASRGTNNMGKFYEELGSNVASIASDMYRLRKGILGK